MKAITFEFWLHQLYRQILKSYLGVLPILIVDYSNTARESGFAIKYGTMPQGMIVICIPNISNISNFKMYYYKTGL